jgi:glutamate--cysteine ligase
MDRSAKKTMGQCHARGMTEAMTAWEAMCLAQHGGIEAWFRARWAQHRPPFYGSVDLRHAGYKLAPVDTNLFPAGFNNLNPDSYPLCVQAIQNSMTVIDPSIHRVLLIPESHTRNLKYLDNVVVLAELLGMAGLDVRLGTLDASVEAPLALTSASGQDLLLHPVQSQDAYLYAGDFKADAVLLNNDLSEGVPAILEGIQQPILPAARLGWAHRSKADHFARYQTVVDDFAAQFDFDPWLLAPYSQRSRPVDFMQGEGVAALAEDVDAVLEKIRAQYTAYGIKQTPFVVVKADAGTYGMAVMMVQDGESLLSLNRKKRTRMAASKGGSKVGHAIIQEGVHTFETVGDPPSVAEPVVYLMGCHAVGGFYRVHSKRGPDENLNAPGMDFIPMPFDQPCNMPCHLKHVNRFYIYSVVARLAMVAATQERVALEQNNEA